ncbi:DUF2336 domain-containing protein [Jiella pelagia]|uniref:DUF2336 domain-containing protein n=1 Tax=Jiella pelagia TaxID=2986949 RepID=A0ABY7C0D4_9HYPH|nr:DUF2336 domain-containing protein [Jiella pelagia]WAP68676.1 DUF2336 domain-containing protein [Jiella pelagia]
MIVQRFAKWAGEATTRERAEAATMLAEALVLGEAEGADRDTIVASLTLLLDDPAPSVRLAMAKVLSGGCNVPRSLVFALAADVAPVAAEIAGRSAHLSTADLIDVAAVGSAAARRAIAERPVVPLPVAAVIAELGEPEAALALCRNDGAAIGDSSFLCLVERFAGDGRLREALLGRADLPPAMRHRLMIAVRDTLAASNLLVNLLGAKRAGVVAFTAAERGTNVLAETLTSRQMPDFGEYLRGSGAVTPSLLVRVVATGNIEPLHHAHRQPLGPLGTPGRRDRWRRQIPGAAGAGNRLRLEGRPCLPVRRGSLALARNCKRRQGVAPGRGARVDPRKGERRRFQRRDTARRPDAAAAPRRRGRARCGPQRGGRHRSLRVRFSTRPSRWTRGSLH